MRGGGRFQNRPGRFPDRKYQPSLAVRGEWEVIEEFDLAQLLKLQANKPEVEDLMWCGHLDQYDESFEKVSTKSARPLKRVESKTFYCVSATDDSIIEKFAAENAGNFFITDTVLSHLMAAPRSVYSWDIVVQKIDGKLFFDKRDFSGFDLLTVSETAHEPPMSSEDMDEINFPDKLSVEATVINQNFSQQILKESPETRKKVRFIGFQHANGIVCRVTLCNSCVVLPRCLIYPVRTEPLCARARSRPGVCSVQIPQIYTGFDCDYIPLRVAWLGTTTW